MCIRRFAVMLTEKLPIILNPQLMPESAKFVFPITWAATILAGCNGNVIGTGGMPERDLDRYFEEIMELKKIYAGKITIRIGLEVDYIEGAEHLAQLIISKLPFDFILGSIHCLPTLGWYHITHYTKVDPEKVYAWYFSAANAAISSGLFQSLAHLDFIWRYIKYPQSQQDDLTELLTNTVSIAASSGTDIEINANGYVWSRAHYTTDFDPFSLMLDIVKKCNASITIGSDAHTPQLVAKCFPEILALLKNKGITHCSIYNQKKKQSVFLG